MKTHTSATAALLLATTMITGSATAFAATSGWDILNQSLSMVEVGNPGNTGNTSPNVSDYGAVDYNYYIGAYEVTNAQYLVFLNAVAAVNDDHGLYNIDNADHINMGITRSGSESDYSYTLKGENYANKPVVFVSFLDAVRFVNWLSTGDTETGVYDFSSNGIRNDSVFLNNNVNFAIANSNEWYKAAFYNPTLGENEGGYSLYPTQEGEISKATANIENGTGGALTDVGSYGKSSYYGTYDQSGNVWEFYDTASAETVANRGGGAGNTTLEWMSSESPGYAQDITLESGDLGFRIVANRLTAVAVPEPGAVAGILGLMMLVLGVWTRVRCGSGTR
jgi:formylglycine-generating enzyme required for sulfatase activity